MDSTPVRKASEDVAPPLFHEVVFFIIESPELPHNAAREIAHRLVGGGARESTPLGPSSVVQMDLQDVTHIVSSTIDFPGYSELENLMIPVVKPEWVDVSLQKDRLAHVRPYTPDPKFFFCGVIATVAELPIGDKEAICGGIIAMGGQYTSSLSKFTTHIVALNMENDKCRQAISKKISVKVVLPHWFDDCLKLNRRIDEAPYLLPNPEIERLDISQPVPLPRGPDLTYSHAHNGGAMAHDPPSPRPNFEVFARKRVRLGEDLELSSRLKTVISTIILQAKGEIVEDVSDANIYVGQFRDGDEYIQAGRAGIHVGSLTWLYWMFAHGKWTSPLGKLLHYPIVRGGLPGMKRFVITVSNYGGDARLYLENLVEACGAKFTKSMKTENTHLITARSHSQKCSAAREWNIHMVNHLWLEESYAKWKVQSMTNQRYTHFPTRTNLMEVVGQTPIDVKTLERFYEIGEDQSSINGSSETRTNGSGLVMLTESGSVAYQSRLHSSPTPLGKMNKRTATNTSTPSRLGKDELSGPSPSISGSGRRAKEQAVARLHEQVMPDVMKYQREQKRKGGVLGTGRSRKSGSPVEDRSRKRTASSTGIETDEDDSKLATKRPKKRPKPSIYLLMTAYRDWVDQPHREDSDKKALADIGIQCVNDPAACTHLAAPHIVRTEKFCCALAKAPVVVSVEWPKVCLREERIVETGPYLLRDSEGEKRLNMNLTESLERARRNGGKLLTGQVVYSTSGVHGGFDTYRRIVEANGGVCVPVGKRAANVPDSDKLVLLSGDDPADRRLWGPFLKTSKARGKKAVIYKSDWLLDLAMTQEVVWSDKYEFTK